MKHLLKYAIGAAVAVILIDRLMKLMATSGDPEESYDDSVGSSEEPDTVETTEDPREPPTVYGP